MALGWSLFVLAMHGDLGATPLTLANASRPTAAQAGPMSMSSMDTDTEHMLAGGAPTP